MIKLFEEYNEYYISLSSEEYGELMIDFDIKESGKLYKRLIGIYAGDYGYNILLRSYGVIECYPFNRWEVTIIAIPDEWYLVRNLYLVDGSDPVYYKCDQFEGLVMLLDVVFGQAKKDMRDYN